MFTKWTDEAHTFCFVTEIDQLKEKKKVLTQQSTLSEHYYTVFYLDTKVTKIFL